MPKSMFTCRCGDYEYPVIKDDPEESTWCECGLRIEQMREAYQ